MAKTEAEYLFRLLLEKQGTPELKLAWTAFEKEMLDGLAEIAKELREQELNS